MAIPSATLGAGGRLLPCRHSAVCWPAQKRCAARVSSLRTVHVGQRTSRGAARRTALPKSAGSGKAVGSSSRPGRNRTDEFRHPRRPRQRRPQMSWQRASSAASVRGVDHLCGPIRQRLPSHYPGSRGPDGAESVKLPRDGRMESPSGGLPAGQLLGILALAIRRPPTRRQEAGWTRPPTR
jgi:hypothetical protein